MYYSSRMSWHRMLWQGMFNNGFPHILFLHHRVWTLFHCIRGYGGRLVSLDYILYPFRFAGCIFTELVSVKHLSLLQVLMCFETICRCWLFGWQNLKERIFQGSNFYPLNERAFVRMFEIWYQLSYSILNLIVGSCDAKFWTCFRRLASYPEDPPWL
jgi:hypothetical protein